MFDLSRFGSRCWLFVLAFWAGLGSASIAASAALPPALDAIRARDHLICGVSEGEDGFSAVDKSGKWSGIDADFCRALAAAVLGDGAKVAFRALNAADRHRALAAGDVDIVAGAATWTLSREAELGLRYAGTLFHDGQGFLIKKSYAIASVFELSGTSICVQKGTNAEQNIADYFQLQQMRYHLVIADHWDEVVKAYLAGSCTLLSADVSQMARAVRSFSAADDYVVLPELIAIEPRGPVIRQGDETWFTVVRWTLMALIQAECLDLTGANVESQKTSTVRAVRRFLGLDANLGQSIGLGADWAGRIVRHVGNYGEMFERNLGAHSNLKLTRGLNNLWSRGGAMLAAPFR